MSLKTTTMSNNNSLNATTTTSNLPATSTSTAAAAAAAAAATVAGVKIKKELPSSDEIKEFAENTMNELLGWYGFDGVDRLDLSTKTSRLLQTAAVAAAAAAAVGNVNNKNSNNHNNNNNNNSNKNNNNNNNNHNKNTLNNSNAQQMSQQQQQQQQQHHPMEKRRSRSTRNAAILNIQQMQQQQQQHRGSALHMRNLSSNNNNINNNNNNNNNINNNNHNTNNINSNNNNVNNNSSSSSCIHDNLSSLGRKNGNCSLHRSGITALGIAAALATGNESTNSDHDTRSSREDDSKSPLSAGKSSTMDDKIDTQNCCWCRRAVPENAPDFLTTSDGPRYCSESCFTQSRRASFKKAKTCDWCKHVRHAVSYVDFQDGASQLQFCSDKCLNQYKMQIFCKETQAHLDMNPHLREQGLEAADNGASLITPDLWLRNCRSRSASPASTISVSPVPPAISLSPPLPAEPTSNGVYNATKTVYAPTVQIHKPLISVAPVSKLMSKSPGIMQNRQSPKHSRKKRTLRSVTASIETPTSATIFKSSQTATALAGGLSVVGSFNKSKALPLAGGGSSGTGAGCGSNSSTHTSPAASVHHLNTGNIGKSSTPSLSQFAGSSVQDLHMSVPPLSPMLEQQHATNAHYNTPSQMNTNAQQNSLPPAFFATPPMGPLPPPTSAHMPPGGFPMRGPFLHNAIPPRFFGGPVPPMLPPEVNAFGALFGAPPPVTVMVPYPIILPLPIPIPVPLPILEFHKAYLSADEREKFKKFEKAMETSDDHASSPPHSKTDEPLDFTKNKADLDVVEANCMQPSTSQKSAAKENVAAAAVAEEETAATTPSTTSNETVDTTEGITHCIVPAEQSPEDCVLQNVEGVDGDNDFAADGVQQKLPKFKITRLQTKRTLLQQTREVESTRPLRKRKRIIDCDFQKIALKDCADDETQQNEPSVNEIDTLADVVNAQQSCDSPGSTKSSSSKKS